MLFKNTHVLIHHRRFPTSSAETTMELIFFRSNIAQVLSKHRERHLSGEFVFPLDAVIFPITVLFLWCCSAPVISIPFMSIFFFLWGDNYLGCALCKDYRVHPMEKEDDRHTKKKWIQMFWHRSGSIVCFCCSNQSVLSCWHKSDRWKWSLISHVTWWPAVMIAVYLGYCIRLSQFRATCIKGSLPTVEQKGSVMRGCLLCSHKVDNLLKKDSCCWAHDISWIKSSV